MLGTTADEMLKSCGGGGAEPSSAGRCETETPSPPFKTPGKYTPLCSNSPATAPHRPTTHGTPRRNRCPSGPIYNPFEQDSIIHLNKPMFSPNVFINNGTSTPRKSENTFKWTIDQQAVLFPAEIEDMPHHQEHLYSMLHDDHTELAAQEAINHFFSNHRIVPSPWTESERVTSHFTSVSTPAARGTTRSEGDKRTGGKEVSCQTNLSLPIDFDLFGILGAFHTQQLKLACAPETEVAGADALLSTSTLRRKLFSQSDKNATSSPRRHSPHRDDVDAAATSPDHLSPSPSVRPSAVYSPLATPSTTHFSSSPIRSCSTGGRFSSSPGYQSDGGATGSGRRISTISSRLFPLARDSGDFGPGIHSGSITSPITSPDISPIKSSLNEKGSRAKLATVKFREQEDSASYDDEAAQTSASSMDVDIDASATGGNIGNWGLSTIRESCLLMDDDVNGDGDGDVLSSAHDTGYQTASIQHDSCQQHTNLTHQMSNLPLLDSAQHSFTDDAPVPRIPVANSRKEVELANILKAHTARLPRKLSTGDHMESEVP